MSKKITSKSMDSRRKADTLLEIFLAEVIGTAFLMYFGCMGLFGKVDAVVGLPPMQGAFVFGFIVASIIVAIGHISKAHLNPAVTLCAYLLDTITPIAAFVYFTAECIGALLGVYLLRISIPRALYEGYNNVTCGFCVTSVHETVSVTQGFLMEFLATSMLIYVVCSVWDPRNANTTDSVAIKFGLLITALSITVGPFTGASLNPARSLAPAVVNNAWDKHWIFWVAPLSASVVTTLFYKKMFLQKDAAIACDDAPSSDQNTAMLKSAKPGSGMTTAEKTADIV